MAVDSGAPRRRGRPPRQEKRDIRRDIIDASRRSFAKHGYEATTIAGIAAHVGISGNTIYHYFGNKRGLWMAVYDETYDRVWGTLREESSGLSVHDAFIAMVSRARKFRHTNGEQTFSDFLYRAGSDMLTNEELASMRPRMMERREIYFRELAERGLKNGELNSLGDVTTAAAVLRVLMLGILHEAHITQSVPEEVISAVEKSLGVFSRTLASAG